MTDSNSNPHNAPSPHFPDRYWTLVGNLSFAILAVLSLVFWRERTILLDAAHQSLKVLATNQLAIQVDRYGAGFVQAFPLWGARWGFSLQAILMSYSLAFVLFHWVCFFITDKVLKVNSLALVIVLFATIMTAHSFFWVQNEIIQGTSFLLMTFGFLVNRGNFSQFRWFDYPLSIFLIFTVYFFHPLTLFPFAFLIAYFGTFLLPFFFFSFLKKIPVSIPQKPPISRGLLLFSSLARQQLGQLNTTSQASATTIKVRRNGLKRISPKLGTHY
ncbi:MAG: hypothetical protein U5L45_21095 [Saprospiraceae bacterium]|nr:hypothetical protein [Saprospiraceae bacterium]